MAEEAGLYVHLPFCAQICPYCDFAVARAAGDAIASYVTALRREIRLCRDNPWPRFVELGTDVTFDTLFLGGGTPSRIPPGKLRHILSDIADNLKIEEPAWIAMEVNPEDASAANLREWRALGVDYLSLGVQSFDEAALRFLGRAHKPSQCARAIDRAREAGFPTVSIDLIYSLPGQTRGDWRRQLQRAVELAPDHISCYSLTIEPGTPFARLERDGRFKPLADDDQADLFFEAHEFLAHHGYRGYEVSNFAVAHRHRSRHNQRYWRHQSYLGLGNSAHSFAGDSRWWNHRQVVAYIRALTEDRRPVADRERLDRRQLLLERAALGLRTTEGIPIDDSPGGLGVGLWQRNRGRIESWIDEGLLVVDSQRLRPTLRGMALADRLARELDLSDA